MLIGVKRKSLGAIGPAYKNVTIHRDDKFDVCPMIPYLEYMLFDIHIHSDISPCGQMSLDLIVSRARQRGLDGVCITDHHSMAGSSRIKEGLQENGLCVIFGMEYSTNQGDFLVFGPFDHIPSGLSAVELLSLVKQQNGVAIGAHPFRANRRMDVRLLEGGYLRLAEGVNGRNKVEENQIAMETLPRLNAVLVGGSDAHTKGELGRVGTEIPCKIENRKQFIEAVKALEGGALQATIIAPGA